jgi:Uma2 family endonuclease
MNMLMSLVTADQFQSMPDAGHYELLDGHLRERTMGVRSGYVGHQLSRLLGNHCADHRLGWILDADTGFQCFPGRPNRVRRPDVSFVRFGRFPGEDLPDGHSRIAPDLAAEVVSPNDLAEAVTEKVNDFLLAGVRLVWVVYPHTRVVTVFRANGSAAFLREDQELTGEDVVPGFRCRVSDLFPSPPAEAASPAPTS